MEAHIADRGSSLVETMTLKIGSDLSRHTRHALAHAVDHVADDRSWKISTVASGAILPLLVAFLPGIMSQSGGSCHAVSVVIVVSSGIAY